VGEWIPATTRLAKRSIQKLAEELGVGEKSSKRQLASLILKGRKVGKTRRLTRGVTAMWHTKKEGWVQSSTFLSIRSRNVRFAVRYNSDFQA
jgi:hypothetical protein